MDLRLAELIQERQAEIDQSGRDKDGETSHVLVDMNKTTYQRPLAVAVPVDGHYHTRRPPYPSGIKQGVTPVFSRSIRTKDINR
jgi:hypothetical protein